MEKNLERKIVINKIITKKFWWGKLKRNTNITHISKLILETINFFFCIYKKWLKTIKKFFISFCINVWKCFINIIKQNKEKLQNEAREKYQNLSKEEKEKRQKRPKTNIKNSLKKKKVKSVNITVIQIKIFLKKKNKRKLSIWDKKLLFCT